MAPRYVRDFAAGPRFASPERDVFDGLGQEARPALPPGTAVEPRDRAARRRPRRRAPVRGRRCAHAAGRSAPARGHLAAVPARRQVRLLQLAADVVPRLRRAGHRRDPRRRPPPRAVPRCSCATSSPGSGRSSPTTPSSCWSSATSRPTAGATIRGGVGLAERVWEMPPPSRRATASPASPSTTWPRVRKMTKLWGDEAGRATKTDRILVLGATEAGRRRASPGAATTSTGPGRRGPCARSRMRAMQQMYHPSDLAAMDPLVLMKNLDHVRMTSRRLSLHPPAAGPPLHARGEPAPRADRPLRRGRATDRGRDGEAPHPRLNPNDPASAGSSDDPSMSDGNEIVRGQAPGVHRREADRDVERPLYRGRVRLGSWVGRRPRRSGSHRGGGARRGLCRRRSAAIIDRDRAAERLLLADDRAGQDGQRRACRTG